MSYLRLGQLKKNSVKLTKSHWLLNLYFYLLISFFILKLFVLIEANYFIILCWFGVQNRETHVYL